VLDVHETASRPPVPDVGLGLGTIDQAVPFHCSMRVSLALVVSRPPTAVQAVVEMHVIPARPSLSVALAFGLGTIDQAVPFHCSMRVCAMRFALEELPTAKHAEAVGQEMLTRVFPVEPAFGLGAIDQVAEVAAAGVNDTRAPKVLATATVSRATSKSENRLPAV
jgi:hypothetical protein